MEEHPVEPELSKSPPRRVRRRGTHGYGTLFSQLLLLPIMVMALFMPLYWTHALLVRTCGPVVTCQIVRHYRMRDKEKDEWPYYVNYRITINGREQTHREMVSLAGYAKTPVGTTVPLQLSPLWPGVDSVLLIPGQSVWGIIWGMGFASLLMLGGTGAMIWYVYVLPARLRNLVCEASRCGALSGQD